MTKKEALSQGFSFDDKDKEEFDEETFKRDLKINKYRLDEECLSHSSRYAFYAEAQSLAKSNVSKAKDNLEYIRAERNLALRNEYQEMGQKVTESFVGSLLEIDPDVNQAKRELREAEETYGRLYVATVAMEVRKGELDNLVKLYCSSYFSVPASGSSKDINEQTSNDIRKNLTEKEKKQ